jgi:hypothetical protein
MSAIPPAAAQAVIVVGGYYNQLPSEMNIFFRRQFFLNMPQPIQQNSVSFPFPRTLTLMNLRVPEQETIAFQDVDFRAYQQNPIAPNEFAPMNPRATATFLHWDFQIGGRSLVNFGTNLSGTRTGALADAAAPNITVGGTQSLSTTNPIAGSYKEQYGPQFTVYGKSNQTIVAKAIVIRPPPFEVRRLTVEITGFIVGENVMRSVNDMNRGILR